MDSLLLEFHYPNSTESIIMNLAIFVQSALLLLCFGTLFYLLYVYKKLCSEHQTLINHSTNLVQGIMDPKYQNEYQVDVFNDIALLQRFLNIKVWYEKEES